MAEIQTKPCLYCGTLFDNQGPGMSQKRFDSRVYCSKDCGNKSRAGKVYRPYQDELQALVAVVAKIDTEAPLFKFLSGQHRKDCQATQDTERFLHPDTIRRDYLDVEVGGGAVTRVILLADLDAQMDDYPAWVEPADEAQLERLSQLLSDKPECKPN